MEHVFVDTWAFQAQASTSDPWHAEAAQAFASLRQAGYGLATSSDVVDEAVTGIHVAMGVRASLAFLDDLEALSAARRIEVLEVNATRRRAGIVLFRRLARDVPRLSLTDCISMALMKELGLKWALTADVHFTRAGRHLAPLFTRERSRLVFHLPPRGDGETR